MIVAGFGFRSAASPDSLRAALAQAQDGVPAITHLATAADKAAALAPLAEILGLPVIGIEPDALVLAPTSTHSRASIHARGAGSVAEASALAGAGAGARLLRQRCISADRMATCAIAQGALP